MSQKKNIENGMCRGKLFFTAPDGISQFFGPCPLYLTLFLFSFFLRPACHKYGARPRFPCFVLRHPPSFCLPFPPPHSSSLSAISPSSSRPAPKSLSPGRHASMGEEEEGGSWPTKGGRLRKGRMPLRRGPLLTKLLMSLTGFSSSPRALPYEGVGGCMKGKRPCPEYSFSQGRSEDSGAFAKEGGGPFCLHLSADAFRRENFLFFASAHGTYCASKRGESFWQRASVYFPLSLKVLNV